MTAKSRPFSPSPDALAAHALLSELRTRIAVQHLPYQHGVEARALESLYEIFGLARKAMKDHPGCRDFAQQTTRMLNVELRPVTTKWHRARTAGLLDSRDGADAFRTDLQAVRRKLRDFLLTLQEMAYGACEPDDDTPTVIAAGDLDDLFAPVAFGMADIATQPDIAAQINAAELTEITRRRADLPSRAQARAGHEAVGLALSGGGIRSATFCFGVLQGLAAKGLLGQVDYLSTVSGGGYAGSFVSSWVGRDGTFGPLANPHGPDAAAFRHVRQHAIVPAEPSDTENAPDYRLHAETEEGPEIGAGWTRNSEKAGEYLSIHLDDPSFAQPIRARLFRNGDDAASWSLHWSRQRERGEKG